jgi:hypothetical protein
MITPKFTTDKVIRRLCWIVPFIMLVDAAFTLFGQPSSFWSDSSNTNEIDPVARFFLVRGVLPYIFWVVLRIVLVLFTASITPRKVGLTILFFFLLEHFWGITSWILYYYHWSDWLQNAFELTIAVLIALSISQTTTKHE